MMRNHKLIQNQIHLMLFIRVKIAKQMNKYNIKNLLVKVKDLRLLILKAKKAKQSKLFLKKIVRNILEVLNQ